MLTAAGGRGGRGNLSQATFSVLDDAVQTINVGAEAFGTLKFTTSDGIAWDLRWSTVTGAVAAVGFNGQPALTNVTTGLTGALAAGGAGGTDGNWNVSAHTDGKIYVKNRRGSTLGFAVAPATGAAAGPTGPQGPAGTIADGDKGDIVVSGSGATWSLDPAVVTAAARTVLDDASTPAMLTTLGAAPSSHAHAQSDVTNLVPDLAAKQATSAKGQASGYASLDGSTLVPIAQVATGTPTGAKFVRDDRTLAVPPDTLPTFANVSALSGDWLGDGVNQTLLAALAALAAGGGGSVANGLSDGAGDLLGDGSNYLSAV